MNAHQRRKIINRRITVVLTLGVLVILFFVIYFQQSRLLKASLGLLSPPSPATNLPLGSTTSFFGFTYVWSAEWWCSCQFTEKDGKKTTLCPADKIRFRGGTYYCEDPEPWTFVDSQDPSGKTCEGVHPNDFAEAYRAVEGIVGLFQVQDPPVTKGTFQCVAHKYLWY